MALSDLLLPLALSAAYVVFVWWLWRDTTAFRVPGPAYHADLYPRVDDHRQRVLFICTHNSARSQIAEALLRHIAGDRFLVASAGTSPTRVHPLAERVMAARGLSLATQWSKRVDEVGQQWDYLITVCDAAFERCPDFPTKTSRLHWGIKDPASVGGTATERFQAFERVRDELSERIGRWVADQRET